MTFEAGLSEDNYNRSVFNKPLDSTTIIMVPYMESILYDTTQSLYTWGSVSTLWLDTNTIVMT